MGGQAHLRLEPVALAEAWLRLRPSAALCGGVNVRVNAAPDFALGTLVPRVGARVMVRRRWWTAFLLELPVAGTDRTDLIAGFYAGFTPRLSRGGRERRPATDACPKARDRYTSAPRMAKYKMKSNSSAKKRFKLTAKGRVKRKHAYLRHNLGAKSSSAKRKLRRGAYVSKTQEHQIKAMLPYGLP